MRRRPRHAASPLLALALLPATAGLTGCVERTITITSEPPGALAWLNDREVGRTPLTVGFLHYGTYDVRLVKEGYEPLLTSGDAKPPLWDNVGPDLVAEVLPWTVESRIEWHYQLEPTEADPDQLRAATIERARDLRTQAEAVAEGDEPSGDAITEPGASTPAPSEPAPSEPAPSEPG